MNDRIKTTIITGFLGSGKTTFINRLLKDYPDREFAVVENEFGEVSVDTRLIRGVNPSHLFELKNGCICCTIADEFEQILQELAERFPSIRELLIETTGVAGPSEVISPFFRSPVIRELYDIRGIFCMVDALNYEDRAGNPLLINQMIASDVLYITKTEAFSSRELSRFREQLKRDYPFAEICCSGPDDEPFMLHSLKGGRPEALLDYYPSMTLKDLGISTRTLRFPGPVERRIFEERLDYFMDIYRNKIFRVKGIISFRNEPFEFIVQAVGRSWIITEGEILQDSAGGFLVFTGNLEGVSFDGFNLTRIAPDF